MPILRTGIFVAWAWYLGLRGCGATPGIVAVAVPVLVPAPPAQRHLRLADHLQQAGHKAKLKVLDSGLLEQVAKRLHVNLDGSQQKARAEEETRAFSLDTALLNAAPAPAGAGPAGVGMTTPLPTDLPAIAARFALIKTQMAALTQDIGQTQTNITLIDAAVNSSSQSLVSAETTLDAVVNASSQNEASSKLLDKNATEATRMVDDANKQMKTLQSTVSQLQATTLSLKGGAEQLTLKVAKLDEATQRMLPGIGSISKRMDTAEATLKAYTSTDKAALDKIVSKSLKRAFKRAVNQVRAITEEQQFAQGG